MRNKGSGFRLRREGSLLNPDPRTLPTAFTLIEMLTTVAVLVIVLGLMVSLARDVRNRSADRLTIDLLTKLDRLMVQYAAQNHQLPQVLPFVDVRAPQESTLKDR